MRVEFWEEKRRHREANWLKLESDGDPAWTDESPTSRVAAREVRNLGRQGRWEEALAAFAGIESPGPWLVAAAMAALARGQQHQAAERLFHEAPVQTTGMYCALVVSRGARDPSDGRQVLEEMRGKQMEPTNPVYNAVINALTRAGRRDEVMEVFQEMRAASVRSCAITYQSVLAALAKAGDRVGAREVLAQMEAEGMTPDIGHLSSLVVSCARHGDEVTARQAFEDLRRRGHKPNVICYTALVRTFRGPEALQKADAVLAEMRQEMVQLDTFAYDALLQNALESGAGGRFRELLAEMDAQRVPRSRETEFLTVEMGRVEDGLAEPHRGSSASGLAAHAAPLPPGWAKATDPASGLDYYWQEADPASTTTWERPV